MSAVPASLSSQQRLDLELELLRLLTEEQEARARKSLTDWSRLAGFEPAPHHKLLIEELEGLERGDFDTLLVFMPPGAAKSTYVNMLFPAWFMARNKSSNLITASHSSELAERFGRKTRNLLAEHARALDCPLATDSSAAYRWSTTSGGEYYAVGVGVGIAGFRADLGVIDDPFGSREDAESPKIRQKVWDWYTDDFSSRLKPGARQVIMHTRWHDDDLAGRKIRQMEALGRRVQMLSLPAEATGPDRLGRVAGDFLWDDPTGYNYGAFLRLRKQESDPRTWSSLYQQNPVPDEGDYFKAEWLKTVSELPDRSTLRVYGASDYAVTANGGDYTVHVVVGLDPDNKLWLLDLWRRQAASDEWVEAFCDLVGKWKPSGWAEETGQIKAGVGPFLERRMRERRVFVLRDQFPTRGDKPTRARSIQGELGRQGMRILASAPYRNDLYAELLRFPAGVHDDQVDALGLVGQLLDKVMKGRKPQPAPPPKKDNSYRFVADRDSGPSVNSL
jgi:predicted phage terminase large subunit-like protein